MIAEIASALFHKDAGAYGDEYQTFLKELRTFHDARGTSFNKLPRVHGREIDLYLLYTLVTTSGGWEKVTAKDDWDTLLPYFGIPRACSNGDSALKQVYVRFLDVYERIHFLGEEVDRREAEMHEEDDSRNKRRNLRLLHALPLTYNHQQHQVTSSVREYAGLSTELAQLSLYERLMLSLLSPLPNEQDFAVNICTLLGGDGKHKLVLDQCPKLVDVLLAHAGVFATVDLRNLLVETYRQSRSMNLEQFWRDVVADPQIRDLVYRDISQELDKDELSLLSSEDPPFSSASGRATPESVLDVDVAPATDQCPSPKKRAAPPPSFCGGAAVVLDGKFVPEVERLAAKTRNSAENESRMEIEAEDRDLFNLGRDLGSKDVLGHRVLQIAMLLRNLSFEEGNVTTLAKNSTVLRFLLLGWHSQWNSLPQMALDALSNLAAEMGLNEPADCAVSAIFLDSLTRGLQASDRFSVLSCMEMVTKLCGKEENEHILSSTLDQSVYESLCRLLTVPDIMLLIYTLECLYALSDLGETACNNILRCQGALDVLVSMLTVEAQSFGSKACILMRVVETAGESDSRALNLNATTSVTNTTITPLAAAIATPVSTATAMSAPSTTLTKPANMTPSTTKAISRVGTPSASASSVSTRPAAKAATTVTKVTTPAMATPSSSAPAYLPAEKEKAAIAWLKSMFDISLGTPSLEQGALYRLYSNAMTQAGNKLILASSSFYSAVKLAFGGSVGPFRKQVGQVVEFHYESLKPKGNLSVAPPETPSILQAHLSSPPKTQTKREQDKTFLPSTPATSSVDNKASTNSLLIKSLLANKVNETPPTPSTLVLRAHHPSTAGPPTSSSMDLNIVLPAPDTSHVHVPVPHVIASSPISSQVVKRQQQQKQQPVLASETQVNGVKLEKNDKPEEADVKPSEMGKGLLANLLEKEIPRTDTVNGGLTTGRELRISDKGLELVINAANEPSPAIATSSTPVPAAPPAVATTTTTTTVDGGKVIAQVDDAGHVQIHLEETSEALSNGQMLLEALEQGEILAASTAAGTITASPMGVAGMGGTGEIKEEAESVKRKRDDKVGPVPAKKAKQENILEKAMELARIEDDEQQQQQPPLAPPTLGQVVLVGNQVLVSSSTSASTTVVATSQIDALQPNQQQQSNIADTKTFFVANQGNTNKAFLILQPQGSRFVLGGPHSQKMVLTVRPPTQSQPQPVPIPLQSQVPAVQMTNQSMGHSTALVTDSSTEGIVTFSGGAVAIPAKNIPKPPIPMTVRAVAPVPVVTSVAIPGNVGAVTVTSTTSTMVTQTSLPAVVTTVPLGAGTGIEVSNSTGSSVTITPVIPPIKKFEKEELAYICEWKGCGKSCKSPAELYLHACHVHCPLTFEEGLCQWDKCDNLKRRRFSLMTHLQDRHCNEEVQRVLALRRQQLSALGKTDIQPLPVPPPHPGYAPHAALQAIKRHALEYMNQKDSPEEKEGPVTKSIRLTAALILRNLVIYSSLGRRCLRRYEPLLCAIALSPVESARTVSQLLYDMANPNTNTSALP